MNKRNSQKKMNGEILLMQTELMSKLATISEPKRNTDDLGFNILPSEEPDALLHLINRSKDITQTNARKIQATRLFLQRESTQRRHQPEGTFLTGLGIAKENQVVGKMRTKTPKLQESDVRQEENDPDQMLKDLIKKRSGDDLQELRKMIKETGSNLEGCSRKLNKSKKSILQMADRYTHEMPSMTLNFLHNYRQFEASNLQNPHF